MINNNTIDKLAKLSSLEIDDSKKESLIQELEEIVGFVENLNDIDVSHVDATFTTVEGGAMLREDIVVSNTTLSDEIIKNSPNNNDGYFIVPKIIE
jgi:aspartyl-tRNA(Asn)/glutamyl-tRNA(Gln) amidotransferase subunit C